MGIVPNVCNEDGSIATIATQPGGEGASQSQKHSAAEKSMSIYQDTPLNSEIPRSNRRGIVRRKDLCLFIKT